MNSGFFSKFRLIIFDLDDTLYEEKIYLFEVYSRIAIYLSKNYSFLNYEEIYLFLTETFNETGRENLLNNLLTKFNIIENIDVLLTIMRTVNLKSKMPLKIKSETLLQSAINSGVKICVLTNGNPIQQKNKVKLIDWLGNESRIDFIYANEVKPKPFIDVFELKIKNKYKIDSASEVLMIGDSLIDQQFAINIKCPFIFIQNL
jgi:putative hydrolase of the HAD superfamily